MLSVGGSFAYSRDTEGIIRVWGDNQFGQLGRGNTSQSYQVREFKTKNSDLDVSLLRDVVTASDYSYMWMEDGQVFGVGNNSYLPLTFKEGSYSTHKLIKLPEAPADIATGFGHVLMLTENGQVYAWGRNSQGQVGNGSTKKTQTPYLFPLSNIVQIACGGKFSLALDQDGQLWGWGDNEHHTLLPNTTENQKKPVKINTGDIKIAHIDACGASVVLLDQDGVLWTWGHNDMYQLGYETKKKSTAEPAPVPLPPPVTFVAAYSSQTYAILTDGSLWSWENNSYGQLGQGFRSATNEGILPGKCWDSDVVLVQSGSLFVVAMTSDGTILTAGISKFGQQGHGDSKSKYALSPNGMDLIIE
ncbi:MAG: hypothetical protein E7324_03815 [Clostridiales bacterium]|nr:hypothetical protein [Clostridiales bacterium]